MIMRKSVIGVREYDGIPRNIDYCCLLHVSATSIKDKTRDRNILSICT